MDKITIVIDTTNDAFAIRPTREARRILTGVLNKKGLAEQKLYDINGNCVGEIKYEYDK